MTPGNVPGTMGTGPAAVGTIGTAPAAAGINGTPVAATAGIIGTAAAAGAVTAGGAATIVLRGSKPARLPAAAADVGVMVGVPPGVSKEDNRVGGNTLGTSMPRSFKLINLHAMLNSLMFILPSASVSANAL